MDLSFDLQNLPSPHLHPGDGTDGQCGDKKYGWMGKSFKQISMDGWMDGYEI